MNTCTHDICLSLESFRMCPVGRSNPNGMGSSARCGVATEIVISCCMCGSMKAAHPLGDDTHAVVTPHTGHLSTDFTRSETRLSRLLFFEIVVSHPVRSGVSGGEPLGQRRGIERGCGHRESVDSTGSHCPAISAVTACLPAVWPETVAICERSCSFRR